MFAGGLTSLGKLSVKLAATSAAASLLIAALAAEPSFAAAAQRPDNPYVALGDSYTAAPGVPKQDASGCLRSDHNYPSLVAATLKPSKFTDVSCSGATTVEMTKAQTSNGATINQPQFKALNRKTRLVTISIGGNDAGFGSIATTCFKLGQTNPTGSPCEDHYTAGGKDQLAAAVKATAPKVGRVLQSIRSRAPHAKVLLVGYPTILPDSGNGCFPELPLAAGDVPYVRGFANSLNAMLASQAKRAHATYVDTHKPTVGHDVCQPTGTRWVEGVKPTSPAAPLHPNALGQQAMATAVLAALRHG
ncbi:MAG: SGNH/GDSL hydrolase family protein [Terriglobales bacterium]